ncbi:MAG: hypothetical protein CSA09_05225 [Candidatus Contendobacter odensis]|uniref:Glycosyltransferase 2-like domain-containing protein n=1 Tax=Candidatus Contendibacter odensensis TaxID=1400860 RepID=A0A2G6PE26_9GAMM|nr:MAG: hypothetical protein CSA09_05225 [Candidatus Contendobacter odensis]
MVSESELIPYHAIHSLGEGPALILAPHPDDEVFGCAGAIMRHVDAGDPVTVIIVTDGGGFLPSGAEREAYVAQRHRESIAAAAVLGYGKPQFWMYRDRELIYDEALVRRLCQAVTVTSACWLYAPSPYELHPDHRHLGFAALETVRRCKGLTLALYEIGAPLPPNRLLDISDLWVRKHQAIACFSSQLAEQAYDRHIEALNRYRTYTLPRNIRMAEAYWVIEGNQSADKMRALYDLIGGHWQVAGVPDATWVQPLVSVIIRTTHRPELAEALASVAVQSYPNIEVIVIDAAGTDLASSAIDSEHYRFPLRVCSAGQALGRAAAANLGLDAVQGAYFIFLDDDDWFEPDHIASLVEMLEQEAHLSSLDQTLSRPVIAAYAGVRCVKHDGKDWATLHVYNEPFDTVRLRLENYIPIHAVLCRREVLTAVAACRFDQQLELYEDWDFWLQLSEHGHFLHRDAISACYRIHQGSGFGVMADEQQALAAFHVIVTKWRSRWSDRDLMDIIAWARHLERLLKQAEEQRAVAVCKVDELGLAIDQYQQTIASLKEINKDMRTECQDRRVKYEEAYVELEQSRRVLEQYQYKQLYSQQELERYQSRLKESQRQLDAVQAQLVAQHAETAQIDQQWRKQYEWVMSSRSWRLTAPLRDSARWLRDQHNRWFTALARRLWQVGVTVYRGRSGWLLSRLPFGWKQAIRRWLRQGMMTIQDGEAARPVETSNAAPLVSIIVPVYNHAEFLECCLRSALQQSYPNIEVIAVDDASSDPEVRVILERLAAHPRLKVFSNPVNQGIARTQNRALMASKGDIIGWLDCDDYLAPDAVEICLRQWHEGIVYAHSARINIDPHGQEVSRISFEHLPRLDYFAENLERMYATHFKLIARQAFARVGLFDLRFDVAQDYDLLMRIAFHYPSSAFIHIPEFVYYHRFHERQATGLQTEQQQIATTTIQHEARLRRDIREGHFDHFLSIIMLSFGKQRQTLAALESLRATVKIPHEIILFDNGSEAETVAFLRAHIDDRFPAVKAIYHPENLGPAAGRREALKQACGSWFLVFDNDEIAEPGWLEELLVRASSAPDVGAVCCKVIFPNRRLQFSGGFIHSIDDELIDLGLYDRDSEVTDLSTAVFRECDWLPIGATLFTINPAPFLHEGYPNVFEDAGVSMALRRRGLRLLNSPASWVWHEHFLFQTELDMEDRYVRSRYDPQSMLTSIASFYAETGLIIQDEYVWRENDLFTLSRDQLKQLLKKRRCVA